MADGWVETTVRGLERWADGTGSPGDADGAGVDVGGVRILLDLAAETLKLGAATELTPEGLRRLLLEEFPGAVMADSEDAPSVLAAAGALVEFLAETAGMGDAEAERLRAELTRIEPELPAALDAAAERYETSVAEVLARLMHDDGVDLTDEEAVQRWSDEFNALPEAERLTRVSEQLYDLEDAAVPPVRLAPTAELAVLARRSELSTQVGKLAGWVGERAVTEAGELTPQDSAAAVAALGLATPRSPARESAGMREIAELARLWRAAVASGALVVADGRVRPGRNGFDGDDEAVLAAWLAAFDAGVTLDAGPEQRLSPFDIVRGDLPGVLIRLYEQPEPAIREELFEALFEHIEEAYDVADLAAIEAASEYALDLEIEDLVDWGVVRIDDEGGHTLTPLGVWGVRELLVADGYTAPLVGDLAGASAAEFLDGLVRHGEDTVEEEIDLWLAGRDHAAAATELLGAMRDGGAGRRGLAAVVLHRTGPQAEPAVRKVLDEPFTGPYARLWLHTHGGHAEPGADDMMWIFADTVAGMLETAEPGEAVEVALADAPPELAPMVGEMWRVDHPDIARVLEALGGHHPDTTVAKAARRSAHKARSARGSG